MTEQQEIMMSLGEHNGLVFTTASREEAEQFVQEWHYSGTLNTIIHHAFTMREPGGLFGDRGPIVACCVFAHPVNRNAKQGEIELVRLARSEPEHEGLDLSWLVGHSLKWLRLNTDYRAVISYADSTHDHHGGIYQATNFYYVGDSNPGIVGFRHPDTDEYIHKKSAYDRFGTSSEKHLKYELGYEPVKGQKKFLYVYPLTKGKRNKEKVLSDLGYEPMRYPKPDWPGGLKPDDHDPLPS